MWRRIIAAVIIGTVLGAACQDGWAFFDSTGQVVRFPPAGPGTMYEGVGFRPASAGVSPGATVTALVGAVGVWGTADKICRLVVGPGKLGVIVRIALAAGMLLAESDAVKDWVNRHGFRLGSGGGFEKKVPGAYGPSPFSGTRGPNPDGISIVGYYPTGQAALDARNAAGGCCGNGAPGTTMYGWDNRWMLLYTRMADYSHQGYVYANAAGWVELGADNWVAATNAEVETAVQTDTQANPAPSDALKAVAAAINATQDAIDAANQAWPQTAAVGQTYPGLTQDQGNALQQAYNESIPTEVKTDLATLTGADPGPYPTPKQPEDWEYTPEQMAAAQYTQDKKLDTERQADYQSTAGSDGNMTEVEPPLPEKKSLTGVLNSFYGAVQSLPIISAFTGWHLEIEADSHIHLPKSTWMGGGTIDLDFADYGWVWEFMGGMLLALTTWRWTLWVFEG
jgi:hypothetical protein